jgi:hypothetical protein
MPKKNATSTTLVLPSDYERWLAAVKQRIFQTQDRTACLTAGSAGLGIRRTTALHYHCVP